MLAIQQNESTAARRRVYFLLLASADGTTPVTGATVTTAAWKNGATATPGGAVTELSGGLYYYEASTGDVDTLGSLLLTFAAATAQTFRCEVTVVEFSPIVTTDVQVGSYATDMTPARTPKFSLSRVGTAGVLTVYDTDDTTVLEILDVTYDSSGRVTAAVPR